MESIQDKIQTTSANIIASYPLAAGLTSISDGKLLINYQHSPLQIQIQSYIYKIQFVLNHLSFFSFYSSQRVLIYTNYFRNIEQRAVINQLPPPTPFPPTLFSTSYNSINSTLSDPLFTQFEREINLLLIGVVEGEAIEITEWRNGEMRRVAEAMRDQVDLFRDQVNSFGSL